MKKKLFYIILMLSVIACRNIESPEDKNISGSKAGVNKQKQDFHPPAEQARFSPEALKLNEKAALLVNDGNELSYLEAIKLLDKAIRIDSTYHMAYANKASVLAKLGMHIEAIHLYKYLVDSIYPDYLEIYPMIAMLYEKIGEDSIAKEYYKMAIHKYSERIIDKKEIFDMINKAHLVYILNNQKGLNEIDSLINVYPTNDELLMYKEYMFIGYDHEKYLEEL
jgi:tetratricopeptide (TPR) repeat protein